MLPFARCLDCVYDEVSERSFNPKAIKLQPLQIEKDRSSVSEVAVFGGLQLTGFAGLLNKCP